MSEMREGLRSVIQGSMARPDAEKESESMPIQPKERTVLRRCLPHWRLTASSSSEFRVRGFLGMRETAFWSTLGRGAILAAAAMATAGLAGCSSSSRFDNTAYSLSSDGGYDQTATASLGPVPPEGVYNGGGGSNAYASATPPRTTPGFDSRGRYTSGNSYTGNTSSGNTYSSGNSYSSGNAYSSNSYSSGSSYTGGGYKPTPVAYRPNDDAGYSASASKYPVQQAVYTPPSPKPASMPAMPPQRVASTDRATLIGPGSKTITVQNGDSLYLYSLRYGVSVESIQKANNLSGISLTAGQKIIIPAKGATVGDDSYIIQAGDSLNSIAKKHGVSEEALASANNISNARSLQIGQELKIPSGGSAPQPTVQARTEAPAPASQPEPAQAKTEDNVRVVRTQKIESPDFGNQSAEKQAEPEPSTASSSQVASTKTLPSPDPMSGQRFRWPVSGRVISNFGSRADGGHNDGIDISVPQGTSVKAAENGVVAYAGNELKVYFNLVLIRHYHNWVSA